VRLRHGFLGVRKSQKRGRHPFRHLSPPQTAELAPLSSAGLVLAACVRGFDSNPAARQCLSKKYLDLGVDTAQVSGSATLHCLENDSFHPEWKGDAFGSGWTTSLTHGRSRIQAAGIDHGGDLPVANQDNKQIGDHGGLALRIEGVGDFLLLEFIESIF
jgi:hypothetical protein